MRDELQHLRTIAAQDQRYHLDAYQFVREALCYASDILEYGKKTTPKLDLESEEPLVLQRHLSGRQLCLGLKHYAVEQFGLMAKSILNFWGIHKSDDVGEIVFNLIDAGVFMKSPDDSKDDFKDVFDFEKELVDDFEFEPVSIFAPVLKNV